MNSSVHRFPHCSISPWSCRKMAGNSKSSSCCEPPSTSSPAWSTAHCCELRHRHSFLYCLCPAQMTMQNTCNAQQCRKIKKLQQQSAALILFHLGEKKKKKESSFTKRTLKSPSSLAFNRAMPVRNIDPKALNCASRKLKHIL